MTGINIVITFKQDMNQLSVKNSLMVILTSIRALSGDIIFIVTKSKLFFLKPIQASNILQPEIFKAICTGRSRCKSANWKLRVQFGENFMSKDAINQVKIDDF